MKYGLSLIYFLFILLFLSSLSGAEKKMMEPKITGGEGAVEIEADSLFYHREDQIYEAHGRVEVRRGDFLLKGDHIQWNSVTKDLLAWGNVVFTEGEDRLECERLEVNLTTKTGKVYQARLFLKEQNFHITGREAEKLGEERYRIREGSFTTCDGEKPPWKFTVKELEITLEGYGVAKGCAFYLEEIPGFYLPWAIFPVKRERQTGFLLPRIGYSQKYGPEIKTAFFWAIRKDMDSTIYLDYLGKRGVKEGVEFRYAFAQGTEGQANFYFIDDQEFHKNRYAYFIQGQQTLPLQFYLKGSINRLSDRSYHRDFDEDLPTMAKIDSRSLGELRSTLFGGRNWDQFVFLAEGVVYQDLTKSSDETTLQRLPQISLYAHPQSLFQTPLFFDLSSSYTHFWREEGLKAHRGDLFPRLSLPLRIFQVLKLNPSIGARETLYKTYDHSPNGREDWESRETVDAGIDLSVEFYRIYETSPLSKLSNYIQVSKWMHTIEPVVGYYYRPRVDQKDLPLFDELDRLPYLNQITYGISQRLVGKPKQGGIYSGPFEYAKLKIFQSYSLGDPFSRDPKGRRRNFSNLYGELWWNFVPFLQARWDGAFDPYDRNFESFNFLLHLKDRREDGLYIQYRYTQPDIEELNVGVKIKPFSPLSLYGTMRYNLKDDWRVENRYGAEYQSQCWTLGIGLEDKGRSPDGTQKKEFKFHIYLNLLGIGSLGKKPSYMNL